MNTQQQLIDRLIAIFGDDDRIRTLHLSGSMATGENDELSDVDTIVGVRPEHFDEVFSTWPQIAAQFGTVLHLQNLPGTPIINQILEPWLRWDVTLADATQVATLPSNLVRTVFDKDQVGLSAPEPKGQVPSEVVEGVTREFVRVMGLLPVVVGRDDVVTGMAGANLVRQLTLQLFTMIADGSQPGGALRAKRVLRPDDYATLAALPVAGPDMPSIIAAHQACWGVFLPRAQQVLGDAFPTQLVQACSARLSASLPRG